MTRTSAGSVTVEAATGMLGLIAVLSLSVAVARGAATDHLVTTAAYAAARAASLARTASDARHDAHAAATTALADGEARCRQVTVHVDTTGFTVPVGRPATVTATVTCRLADLAPVPGLPATLARTATFTSPLDQYRGR